MEPKLSFDEQALEAIRAAALRNVRLPTLEEQRAVVEKLRQEVAVQKAIIENASWWQVWAIFGAVWRLNLLAAAKSRAEIRLFRCEATGTITVRRVLRAEVRGRFLDVRRAIADRESADNVNALAEVAARVANNR